jgi:hypothetical protein
MPDTRLEPRRATVVAPASPLSSLKNDRISISRKDDHHPDAYFSGTLIIVEKSEAGRRLGWFKLLLKKRPDIVLQLMRILQLCLCLMQLNQSY